MVVVSDRELQSQIGFVPGIPVLHSAPGRKFMGDFSSDSFGRFAGRRGLFATDRSVGGFGSTGAGALLPDSDLEDSLLNDNGFVIDPEPEENQFQGASLDLRVGEEVFVMEGNFTSLGISEIERHAREKQVLSFGEEFVLHPGEVYVVKSTERIRIPSEFQGISDAKSSLARIGCGAGAATIRDGIIWGDDYHTEPEHIYFKMRPHAFPILLRAGQSVPVQVRFREAGSGPLAAEEIRKIYGDRIKLSVNGSDVPVGTPHLFEENGLVLTLDTSEYYVQRRTDKPIDITRKRFYDPEEFFEFVRDGEGTEVEPGRLYLFGSRETIHLDRLTCGDLVRSPDTLGQALSNNFARFIQAGFTGEITMEVWNYDSFGKPWFLKNGQYFGRVLVEMLDGFPKNPYTQNGSYPNQKAPRLPGYFK